MNQQPFPTKKFFILSTLFILMFYGTNPLLQRLGLDSYRFSPEARAFSDTIVSFDDKRVHDLAKAGNKPLMLHIYASWCPYCRQQNPLILDLISASGAKMDVVMLSLDSSKYKLAEFLLNKPQPLPYTPFILEPSASRTLMGLLQSQNSKFDGGIPYTAFFNSDGKIVADFLGVADKGQLDAGFAQAIRH